MSPKYETSPTGVNHHQLSPPAPVSQNTTTLFPTAAPENAPMKQEFRVNQQMQHSFEYPPLHEQRTPSPEGRMTLFQWQIQQESRKVEGISLEQLSMQDSDGDTYVCMNEGITLTSGYLNKDQCHRIR